MQLDCKGFEKAGLFFHQGFSNINFSWRFYIFYPQVFVSSEGFDVDKTGKKVSLSIKSLELSDEKEALEQYGTSSSGASLGDILGAAIKGKSRTNEDDSIKKDDKQSEEE